MNSVKRYRIFGFALDTRAAMLSPAGPSWEEQVRILHNDSATNLVEGLVAEYGSRDFPTKIERFRQFGAIPFSFAPQHFSFLCQIRDAYVVGAHFPAIVAATVFGERLLNEIVQKTRRYFPPHPKYAQTIASERIVKWEIMLATLKDWGILDQVSAEAFRDLFKVRQASVHYAPSLAKRLPDLARRAYEAVNKIISHQFGFQGRHPWRLNVPGCMFVGGAYGDDAFVREFVLPVAVYVGPYHRLRRTENGWTFEDRDDYADLSLTDDEYVVQFKAYEATKAVDPRLLSTTV